MLEPTAGDGVSSKGLSMVLGWSITFIEIPTHAGKLTAITAQVINDTTAERALCPHRKIVGGEEINFLKFGVQGDELRLIPLVIRQAFPNRLKLDVQHGDANQVRNEYGFGADGIMQPRHQFDVLQRLLGLIGLQLGYGA